VRRLGDCRRRSSDSSCPRDLLVPNVHVGVRLTATGRVSSAEISRMIEEFGATKAIGLAAANERVNSQPVIAQRVYSFVLYRHL
jgi:hypothetical protein